MFAFVLNAQSRREGLLPEVWQSRQCSECLRSCQLGDTPTQSVKSDNAHLVPCFITLLAEALIYKNSARSSSKDQDQGNVAKRSYGSCICRPQWAQLGREGYMRRVSWPTIPEGKIPEVQGMEGGYHHAITMGRGLQASCLLMH